MPGTTASASAPVKPSEPEKPIKTAKQIEIGADDNMEETVEEEVEHEEIEEEVEVEVEKDEEKEDNEEVDGHGGRKGLEGDDNMETSEGEEDTEKKHAELLALPPQGSEVYLGGIPQNISEDDLKCFCESVGEVTTVRIMKMKDSNKNKGYAFVAFRNKEIAVDATVELHNAEFKGKKLKCFTYQTTNKLFIGKVPKKWGEEDMKKIVNKAGPGVIAVELVKDPKNASLNRGYAFIEYYNQACAEYSRKKMSNSKFKWDGNAPIVRWAESSESLSSQVKAIYVKNLPENVTRDQLKELFDHHGEITSVVIPRAKPGQEKSRFGFLHFAERSSALKALYSTENYEIDGQVLECSLARRQGDQKSSGGSNSQKAAILPTYPPHMGYAGTGFAQPLMYGRGAHPGMASMPMLSPDGRIVYVPQQPGIQPHTLPPHQRGGRGSGRERSRRGSGRERSRRGSDGHHGRGRYNPY